GTYSATMPFPNAQAGLLDIIAEGKGWFWHTQVLPGLTLSAKPHKFSHTSATVVTFAVTDAGQPVAGATVSCLGKTASTDGTGTPKIKSPRETRAGKHRATTRKRGYAQGKTAIKVT